MPGKSSRGSSHEMARNDHDDLTERSTAPRRPATPFRFAPARPTASLRSIAARCPNEPSRGRPNRWLNEGNIDVQTTYRATTTPVVPPAYAIALPRRRLAAVPKRNRPLPAGRTEIMEALLLEKARRSRRMMASKNWRGKVLVPFGTKTLK